MPGTVATGRNIFYRGYVIHEDVPTICYSIYDRRPDRTELATVGTSLYAMKWVDSRIAIEEKLGDTQVTIQELLLLARGMLAA